ncbi:MlaD family protein [Gordonia otitidis]|uniref:Mce family protein n=1 Tax=Gordonia otitidis (strain DSM 44809 / CCUG 52243 / JCM 12355 / NBRC 100426 / IFM 10032) TaxID=1108044 RepID=H5TLA4_GORO1|nr:MCE family protein [Gordonia otitidis]GAB34262.1 Mce family protein [Gordonia otitidis NBRC 100426]
MNVATDGRNPSLRQYVLRGLIFVVVLAIMFVVLFMRYQGAFDSVVPVRAQMEDIGDGLVDSADVRYNGLIVGEVKAMALSTETGAGGKQLKVVDIDLDPGQAEGIPANVTARTVPSNLFGVNSVELVAPGQPVAEHISDGATIPADRSLATIKLQDAQNDLRTLLTAVPPEQLATVLGTIADALRGGGAVFGMFSGELKTYFESINAQFPDGAPSGFDNFNDSVTGLAQSAPELLNTLGRSVIPAMTIASHQRDMTALLTAASSTVDQAQALFVRNGDVAKRLVPDLDTTIGAVTLEPEALPQALTALNELAARAVTVFTGLNGHVQVNIGLSFGAFNQYTRANCPVYNGGPYGQARGPGCVGPGTGTGPTSSGPLLVSPASTHVKTDPTPSAAGAVTTDADNATLTAALDRAPRAADTLMLGPLVQSVSLEPAQDNRTGGGR